MWLSLRAFLLAFCTPPVVAGGISDSSSFLQVQVNAGHKPLLPGCKCIEWAKAYKDHNVTCGQGAEFYFAFNNNTALHKRDPKLLLARGEYAEEFCTNFFEKVHNNYGVRIKYNTAPAQAGRKWYDKSWCYVSNTCTELNGGAAVPETSVSWKVCEKGRDTMLSQLQPESIIRGSNSHDYDLSVISGYAFYVAHRPVIEEKLQHEMSKTGLPIVLVPMDNKAGRRLVFGKKSWMMYPNPDKSYKARLGTKWNVLDLNPTKPPVEHVVETTHAPLFLTNTLEMDGCQCLEWEKVYGQFGVKCGQGLELYSLIPGNRSAFSVNDSQMLRALEERGEEICNHFFERAYHSNGVRVKTNIDVSEAGKRWYDQTWCYTGYKCPNYRGGARIPGTRVAWKIVEPGRYKFSEYTVPELIQESKQFGYDLALLASYSFRTIAADAPAVEAKLNAARKRNEPIFFMVEEGKHKLIQGNQSWTMTRNFQEKMWPGKFWTSEGPESLPPL